MQLFYFQPVGHGPASLFVCAESAGAAAEALNAYVQHQPADTYLYGSRPFLASDLKAAPVGKVVENDNA